MPAAADTAPFAGLWEDDAGGIVSVSGAKATGPSGEALDFAVVSRKKCALKVASKVSQGTLAADGSKISWSNGSSWTRRQEEASGQTTNGSGKQALEGPAAEELGAWLRSVDGPKLAQYWQKLCGLVSGVKDVRDRYADRPQDFLADLGVEHPGHRSAFTRALRALRDAEADVLEPVASARPPPALEAPEGQPQEADLAEGGLTLERVLRLQRELYVAFADEGFQRRLAEVEAAHGTARQSYGQAHTELFLTVQNKLLPKYGFAEGQKGVLEMLKASARFNSNRQFQRNRTMLNQLLGLAPQRGEREKHLAEIAAQQEDKLPPMPETLQLSGASGPSLMSLAGQASQSASEPQQEGTQLQG